jgi:DNA-binding transcriptional regulator YbjK
MQLITAKREALAPNFDYNANSKFIEQHVKQNFENKLEPVVEEENLPTRKIFIDHVICNDTKFTDSEVRDHVYTVVAAGSETTALQTAHTSEFRIRLRLTLF